MRIIMRADDLGFSEAVNYGILKSIKDGVINSVGLMPNMEFAEHGIRLMKEYDIALGQHTNICAGQPITNPKLIPSLVNDMGQFYTSHEINSRIIDTINVQECEIEIEAQLKRFIQLTGKTPDYFEGHAVMAKNFLIALENVAKRHNLFYCDPSFTIEWCKENKMRCAGFMKLDKNNLYDPREYFENNVKNLKDEHCVLVVFHPGYLDQSILTQSSFTLIRPMECEFLCSEWLQQWLKENDVKLVDFRNYNLQ